MEDVIERDGEEDAWGDDGEGTTQEEVDAWGDDRHVGDRTETSALHKKHPSL